MDPKDQFKLKKKIKILIFKTFFFFTKINQSDEKAPKNTTDLIVYHFQDLVVKDQIFRTLLLVAEA